MAKVNFSDLVGSLAAVIRERRLDLERSQEAVAHEAGLSVRHYAQLETGGAANPTLRSIFSVCSVLDIEMNDLVTDAVALAKRGNRKRAT